MSDEQREQSLQGGTNGKGDSEPPLRVLQHIAYSTVDEVKKRERLTGDRGLDLEPSVYLVPKAVENGDVQMHAAHLSVWSNAPNNQPRWHVDASQVPHQGIVRQLGETKFSFTQQVHACFALANEADVDAFAAAVLAALSFALIGCGGHAAVAPTSAPPAPALATPSPSPSAVVTAPAPPQAAPAASTPAAASAAPAEAPAEAPTKAGSFAGLGLADVGVHGGGRGEGICLCGPSKPKTARIRYGSLVVLGHGLPPEVIQRVVRNDNARLLRCYQVGLKADPRLQGRIAVKFVIDAAGAIASVSTGAAEVGNADVVACVLGEIGKLRFPPLDAGPKLTATYELELLPASR